MAMGTRKMRERQPDLWYGGELPTAPGHPFYSKRTTNPQSAASGRPARGSQFRHIGQFAVVHTGQNIQ
jgi:hypothetical protein